METIVFCIEQLSNYRKNIMDTLDISARVCKEEDCQKDGQRFTSQMHQISQSCKNCTCTLLGQVACQDVQCQTTLEDCVDPQVKITYYASISPKCLCKKQVCSVPGSFTIKTIRNRNVLLTCSIRNVPWSFEGKNIQKSKKYAMNETSLMIRNIEYSDNETYTCNDGKLYFLRVIEDKTLSLDQNTKQRKSISKIVYIVVPIVVVVLIAVVVMLFFAKYKHNQSKEKKEAWNNNESLIKRKEAAYVELTGVGKESEYSKLNASTLSGSGNEPHITNACGYEVSPELVEDETGKDGKGFIQFEARQEGLQDLEKSTKQYIDLPPYISAEENKSTNKFAGYEISPELVKESF
ncbi:uncharacterized protein LOC130625989 isoform X2 [Hydractinia symbiolongicarpus]|uniref:uncharacterized protein LOC130625989 isoform X2 n=1 Tax=Hydractinia symbiolongicarpus TaxID=13093 RepID=UPI00254E0538|nr:uncharacterized protein LOC130625989 isoform X2 [Hydractinia symbiolongicarpus]